MSEIAWFVDGVARTTVTGTVRAIDSKGKVVLEKTLDAVEFTDTELKIVEKSSFVGPHDGLTLVLSHQYVFASLDE